MLRKILTGFLAASAMFAVAMPTKAASNPLTWTNLSSQLSVRTNRPVWAMAYANNSWFYTDGQDLWNGGQVYRYDGYTQFNITLDVRNAGLSRVDDIVSDGQSVLFLKNIAPRNNQFEVVKYQYGSYTNFTGVLRNAFTSDEGIVSVTGRNNEWYVVTSKARVLKWTGDASTPYQITLPEQLRNDLNTMYQDTVQQGRNGLDYCRLNIESQYCTLHILPISNNQWLFTAAQVGTNHSIDHYIQVTAYRYNGSNFSDISSQVRSYLGGYSAITAQSNGKEALISARAAGTTYAVLISDTNLRQAAQKSCLDLSGVIGINCFSVFQETSFWTGTQWVFIGTNRIDQNISRIIYSLSETGDITYLGQASDYFVTGASNNAGTILLGGAVSDNAHHYGPSSPLTAKLVKITEGVRGQSYGNDAMGGGQTINSTYGPTLVTSGNPASFRIGNGGTFIYRATASDANGVNRIEIFVNSTRIKTCYATTCEFESQYYTNGQSLRTMPFSAQAFDQQGYSTVLPYADYLTIDNASNATAGSSNTSNTGNTSNQTTSNNISSWSWFDPNQSTIRRDQNVTFNLGTWSSKGISRVEIYVNGIVRRTCELGTAYGNQACAYILWGGDYAFGTQVAINAKITAGNSQVTWSPLSYLTVTDTNGSSTPVPTQSNSNTAVWAWSTPELYNLATNASVNFTVGAYDVDGLSKIEMIVNGSTWKTCDLGTAYGNRECSVTMSGSSFPVNTDFFVNTKVTDIYGNITWSPSRTYHVVSSTSTANPNGSNPATWIWSSPDVAQLTNGQSATWNVGAWDANGLKRVEIWVNGQIKKICLYKSIAYGNQTCAFAVKADAYPAGTSVFINARAEDALGNITWSSSKSYTITSSTYGNNPVPVGEDNLPGSISVSSNRDSGYHNGQTVVYTVSAKDQNGIDRIEIYVNGVRVQTCYNAGSCSWTGGPYNNRNFVNYGATVVDKSGYALWTGYKTIKKI